MTVFLNETQTLRARSKRWREINAKRGAYQKLFEDVLADGMAEGAFRRLPVNLTALGMLGTVTWAYRWYRSDGLEPDEIADLYVDIVLNGIAV
jgi:AcrR family transcriptional regulator